MDLRLLAAVGAGKAAAFATRRLGSGGTALPGLIACTIDGDLVHRLGSQIRTRILVTGTNGKTTTCRALAAILAAEGRPYLHNREGSNMTRGFASTLLAATSLSGQLPSCDVGLFETDEATLPAAVQALRPQIIAFTNLFRDQLDRYGEVDTVASIWREALAIAPRECCLVVNVDDPLVASLGEDWPGAVHGFGLELEGSDGAEPEYADARWCTSCGAPLAYDRRYFAHIGRWRCDGCGRQAPAAETKGHQVRVRADSVSFAATSLSGTLEVPLAGAYNAYNAVAAIAIARALGIGAESIRRGLESVKPAFGRQEMVEFEGRRLRLLLTKNPAGANQALRFLREVAGTAGELQLAVLLNDRHADGRDVSWIWDVNYELLAPSIAGCWTGGLRAEDMALRLKYAGWPIPRATVRGPARLLTDILETAKPGDEIFVLPTYTAMLELRAELVRQGAASPYWERAP